MTREPAPDDAFKRWLETPDAPRTIAYHTGRLDMDRASDAALRRLAATVFHASGALPPSEPVRGRHHGRPGPSGPALVALTQRRLAEDRYEYLATRLPRRRDRP